MIGPKLPCSKSFYLRQVNRVNGADTVFVRRVSVCGVSAQRTCQLPFWAFNPYTSKTVKATDFKFDMHVSKGPRLGYVTPNFLGVKC